MWFDLVHSFQFECSQPISVVLTAARWRYGLVRCFDDGIRALRLESGTEISIRPVCDTAASPPSGDGNDHSRVAGNKNVSRHQDVNEMLCREGGNP
jgi:hypothetical protein